MERGGGQHAWPGARASVTARESEILSWVAAGKSDWAIGQILKISGKTVNFHVENAKRKFGVGSRAVQIGQ
jgi:DNA-binding CsgD family transcriptional regulator